MRSKCFLFASVALLLFSSGCGTSTPRAVPWALADDSYSASVTEKGKWTVSYDHFVNIEVDTDNVVHVYALPYYVSSNAYYPNVKLSGEGVSFKVHECNNVKADEGVIVEAFGCTLVKAMPKSQITAHNCDLVVAADTAASVQAHGRTSIKQVTMPKPEAPQAPAAK